MNSRVARIDHIQIAAPEGCEQAAREFYGSILRMREIEKPRAVQRRVRGCWFECEARSKSILVWKGILGHPIRRILLLPCSIWRNSGKY